MIRAASSEELSFSSRLSPRTSKRSTGRKIRRGDDAVDAPEVRRTLQAVLRSVIARTMQPGPHFSTSCAWILSKSPLLSAFCRPL